ncbi:MAG: ferritin-like domain-containing protein [Streptosporangiales bacterium]|nr:ferritin-like domain-containing protein [Streptosporangiales bacterium]MBO0891811.1 ferritin-like domain-containing protein [Acidothermales bacterium]
MPTNGKGRLVTWLDDAYSMERALEHLLEQHAKDAEGHAEVHERLTRHLEETRRQAETVKGCVEELGGSVSRPKKAFAKFFGAGQAMTNKPLQDTLVKNAIADYAAEHFEIASYRALIDAAEQLGEAEVADKLRPILRQEEDMARFLEQHLPPVVHEQLGQGAS